MKFLRKVTSQFWENKKKVTFIRFFLPLIFTKKISITLSMVYVGVDTQWNALSKKERLIPKCWSYQVQ